MKQIMKCIVHYPNQGKYTKLKSLSDVSKTKIKKAKEVRENLGGKNHNLLQCEGVPEVFNDNLHGVHSEPCCKK